jgi:hypothetical protein
VRWEVNPNSKGLNFKTFFNTYKYLRMNDGEGERAVFGERAEQEGTRDYKQQHAHIRNL